MLASSLILCLFLGLSSAATSCRRLETEEAENAFKNCVESAQSGIVTTVLDEGASLDICSALDGMLEVCSGEMSRLAQCKGRQHADRIKRLHLSVTAEIVHSIDRRVEECDVFAKKFDDSTNDIDDKGDSRTSRNPEAEPEGSDRYVGNSATPDAKRNYGLLLAVAMVVAVWR